MNLSRFSFVDKPFSESGHLKNHMRTHCGEKQFVCRECSMSFSVAGHLRNHMRSHSKFISQAQHLKHHMRTHSGEKPFVYKEFSVLLSSSTSEVTWGVILEKSPLFVIQEKKHLFIRNVQTSHLKFRGELWRHFFIFFWGGGTSYNCFTNIPMGIFWKGTSNSCFITIPGGLRITHPYKI